MRCRLDVHGVSIEIESGDAAALRGVREDFRFFQSVDAPESGALNSPPPAPLRPGREVPDAASADVRVRLELGPPVLPANAGRPRLLFRAGGNTVYRSRGLRYVDHQRGSALAVFDPRTDEGTLVAATPEALRAAAYLYVLSRVGSRLDAAGLHRVHALGVAIGGRAALFVAGSGIGKTTLGLSLMALGENVQWLADEIPILDGDLAVRPFPLPPRLVEGSSIPWPPPPVALTRLERGKPPAKVQLDLGAILPRVSRPAPLAGVFLCGRRRDGGPTSVRRAPLSRALPPVLRYLVFGRDFPHTKAYWLDLSPRGLARHAAVVASRAALASKLLARVPAFEIEFSADPVEGAAAAGAALESRLGLAPGPRPAPRRGSGGDDEIDVDIDVEKFLAGKGEEGRSCSDPTDATGIS